MRANIKSVLQVKSGSFEEAEGLDIEYYAKINWKESVKNVEEMRRMIWGVKYNEKRINVISIAGLKDDRDDFE